MDIHEYFRQFTYDPIPEHGTKPIQVVWTDIGEMELRGSSVSVGDSWHMTFDSVSVHIVPGVYQLTAECFSYGTDGRVARVRGVLSGRSPDASTLEGEISIDVGSAGIIDGDAFEAWVNDHEDDYESWSQKFMDAQVGDVSVCGFFPCPGANATLFHVSAGFGDGAYPVYSLSQAGEPVGFEVVFLRPGTGFFEDDEGEDEDEE